MIHRRAGWAGAVPATSTEAPDVQSTEAECAALEAVSAAAEPAAMAAQVESAAAVRLAATAVAEVPAAGAEGPREAVEVPAAVGAAARTSSSLRPALGLTGAGLLFLQLGKRFPTNCIYEV